MNNEITLFNYLKDVLGSYDPFSLRISVNKVYSEKSNSVSGIEAFEKRDYATLFHEFMHQLQNTSSIVGFQQFDRIISIWHNTRNRSYDPNDNESEERLYDSLKKLKEYSCHKNDAMQKSDLLNIDNIENEDLIKKTNIYE